MAILALVAGSSALSYADDNTFLEISKGISMTVLDPNQPNLQAFPFEGGCRNWLYIPTRLFLSGKYSHSTDFSVFTVNQQKVTTLISLLKMNASPQITEEAVNKLRLDIFKSIQSDKFNNCVAKPTKPEDIYLGPAQARLGSARYAVSTDNEKNETDFTYWELYPNGSRDVTRGTIMTSDPISLKYSIDATTKNAIGTLQDAIEPGAQLGSVAYLLHGVTTRVHGKLTLKKDMIAAFESKILELCSRSSGKDKGGGFWSGGPFSYGKSKTRINCNQEQTTTLVRAELDAYAELQLPSHEYGAKAPRILPCDENGCDKVPMDIDQYVRMELFNLLMELNLDYISRLLESRAADKDQTRGAHGEVPVNFQTSTEFRKAITGYILFTAQVISQNLNGVLNTDFITWPSYTCAMAHPSPRLPGTPMAIPDQCLAAGTGR